MGAEWSIPGFGWAKEKGNVSLEQLGDVTINDGKLSFDVKALLKDHFSAYPDLDLSEALQQMERHYEEHADEQTKHEIVSSGGMSNGRQLTWNIMVIDANMRFRLHAHPNIELIYVVEGAMHEYREVSEDSSIPDYPEPPPSGHCEGPRLDSADLQAKLRFERRIVPTGECLFNPLSSIHLSFTLPKTTLIVIWGGGHANVPLTALPKAVERFTYT